MNALRVTRLLKLATCPKNHKRWYHQYYWLARHGLIEWSLGTAFLTPKGQEYLDQGGYNGTAVFSGD